MWYYRVLLHKPSYSETNIIFDSLSTESNMQTIAGGFSLSKEMNKSDELKLVFPSYYASVLKRGDILEVRGSDSIYNYTSNILFYGYIYSTEITKDTVSIIAHGLISLLNYSWCLFYNEEIYKNTMCGDIITALFNGDNYITEIPQKTTLKARKYPFSVIPLIGSDVLFNEKVEALKVMPRMELFKKVITASQKNNPRYPLFVFEKGYSVYITNIDYSKPSKELLTISDYSIIDYNIQPSSSEQYNAIFAYNIDKDTNQVNSITLDVSNTAMPLYSFEEAPRDNTEDLVSFAKSHLEAQYKISAEFSLSTIAGISIGDIVRFREYILCINSITIRDNGVYTIKTTGVWDKHFPF